MDGSHPLPAIDKWNALSHPVAGASSATDALMSRSHEAMAVMADHRAVILGFEEPQDSAILVKWHLMKEWQ